jgi:hypothetical protein
MLLDYSMERTSRKGERRLAASLALHLVWEKWTGMRKEKSLVLAQGGLS